jgi:heme-degrading monooxygenase HmoA
MTVWTQGTWKIRPGREDEFVRQWRDLARLALDKFDVTTPPRFLRDRDDPSVFLSFGAWDNEETVARFRELIAPHVAAMDELLETFETRTLDEVGLG